MFRKSARLSSSEGIDELHATPSPRKIAARADMRRTLVVAPNLHWRRTGVTTTIVSLLPRQCRAMAIAAVGPFLPPEVPRLSFWRILLGGWRAPPGYANRVWHARRNDEMIVGIVLKHVLRQPWTLMFTSAAQRRHSRFTHWLLDRMDQIVSTSVGAARALGRPSTVIAHGVDTQRYEPAANRTAAWNQTGLPGQAGIGCFARLRPQKGTDLFVEALIRVLPKHPGVTGVLTGLARRDFRSFEAELKGRVAAAGLSDRILFLGERPSEEMPNWFRCMTGYVAPMRSEGFGLTVLEAMASGAAVIATRAGAAPDLVVDEETGYLIPVDDVEALVQAMDRMLSDPARTEAMGRLGRAKAVAEHDIQTEADRLVDIYLGLLKTER